ncbi:unnamed protein product [Meloidogyne enterolobii]|uniref:Uncharacterized protein n=1 Tax=Meloidogyne enterolobii TaxID=390850 RepID=A0ACB0XQC5_MELEN
MNNVKNENNQQSKVFFDFKFQKNFPKEKPKHLNNCTTQVQIIDKLLNGTGYNKYRIPAENGVDVGIEFWIQAITEINEITNDFEMDIYINEVNFEEKKKF